ncbi:hypothetical protein CY34DRAFT_16757 [Suillus luteus UH-Slu-Lm8-n1]|uniref:Uncharacterized protein n=1 Tax=Suillus luteus UH-Slu-Lm8-n1 TaxID=930992 RepID=A0A0D0A2F7_9AGAM|nr:hypothetical protein CY34DRAFT_16757 [Suillus luteus UH-Slu-Lm8-n1]
MRASHPPRICYRAIFIGAACRRAPRSLFPETETRLTHAPAMAGHIGPKFVNETVTNATKDLAGIGQVPEIVLLQRLAPYNPSIPFNTIINDVANHPYTKVALSICTRASKMILDQADRDVAVSRLLSKIFKVYKRRN